MVKGLKELKIEMEKEGIDSNLKNVNLIIDFMRIFYLYSDFEDKTFENLLDYAIRCLKVASK